MNVVQQRDFEWWRLPTWRPGRVIDTKYIRVVATVLFGILFAIIYGLAFMTWEGFLVGWLVGAFFIQQGSGGIQVQSAAGTQHLPAAR